MSSSLPKDIVIGSFVALLVAVPFGSFFLFQIWSRHHKQHVPFSKLISWIVLASICGAATLGAIILIAVDGYKSNKKLRKAR